MRIFLRACVLLPAVVCLSSAALVLDVTDQGSIRSTASTIAYGMMKYYTGNVTNTEGTIGVLPAPYYWWESGAMWGAMLDYYHNTGDDSYKNVTTQALLSQVGPNHDYMVPRHQGDEGNDDQAFWGFATMSAAEKGYPEPVGGYSWLQLTENLWNTQVRRWDTSTCGGGLKWQIFPSNNGYNYKNSISNNAFFQISARLARFTGNQTYADWANKSYDWSVNTGLIDSNYNVYDGADDMNNCSSVNHIVWTYNTAVALYGAAVMYNRTSSDLWAQRTQGFLTASAKFFGPYENSTNIMYEPACETVGTCNTDQFSFKGYLSRFLSATSIMAPFTAVKIKTMITASAQAAAKACSGGDDGVTCGECWYRGGYDGKYGVGQQMSALETVQALLAPGSGAPLRKEQLESIQPTTYVDTQTISKLLGMSQSISEIIMPGTTKTSVDNYATNETKTHLIWPTAPSSGCHTNQMNHTTTMATTPIMTIAPSSGCTSTTQPRSHGTVPITIEPSSGVPGTNRIAQSPTKTFLPVATLAPLNNSGAIATHMNWLLWSIANTIVLYACL